MKQILNNKLAIAGRVLFASLLFLGTPAGPLFADYDENERFDDEARELEPWDDDEGDNYATGDFGRILFADDGLTLRRSGSDGTTRQGVNAPIYPGDTLLTELRQRAELELAGGTLIRVDRNAELNFLSLPNPYAEVADNTVLRLSQGAIRLDARLAQDGDFRVDTSAASIYLFDDADLRIEVYDTGLTIVRSVSGVAEVVANNGSVIVRSGNMTEIYPGSVPSRAEPFNTFAADRFDRWVEERNDLYGAYDRYEEFDEVAEDLPYEVRPHYRELRRSGSWQTHNEYGRVWYPRGVRDDWRPYQNGYWDYGPNGYFWVSNDPWGWAPYRYGRWEFLNGWCWIPGRRFGGSWVSWSWGSNHVGWAPLGFRNRAVVAVGLGFGFGNYWDRCWNFVNYNGFRRFGYGHRYSYVGLRSVEREFRNRRPVRRAVRLSPRELADAPRRERAIARVNARPARGAGAGAARKIDRQADFRRAERSSRSRLVERTRAGATRGSNNDRIRPKSTRRSTVRGDRGERISTGQGRDPRAGRTPRADARRPRGESAGASGLQQRNGGTAARDRNFAGRSRNTDARAERTRTGRDRTSQGRATRDRASQSRTSQGRADRTRATRSTERTPSRSRADRTRSSQQNRGNDRSRANGRTRSDRERSGEQARPPRTGAPRERAPQAQGRERQPASRRDLYQRGTPRRNEPSASQGRERTTRTPRANTRPPQQRATPRSRPSAPKRQAAPSRSRSSAPKRQAAPSRSRSSAPKRQAAPSRSRSSAPKRQAAPSRSRSSAPKRQAAPSRSRSSAPKRQAAPSRSRSSAPKRQAAPSRSRSSSSGRSSSGKSRSSRRGRN